MTALNPAEQIDAAGQPAIDVESLVERRQRDIKDALIMMVDDEPIMMEILQVFLESEGYSRFVALADSTQAMGEINRLRPEILLLDLNMPEVDGFQILEQVRQNSAMSTMPVIVLTANSDSDSKLRALELGATDFLAKPVDASELALRIKNTLAVKSYHDYLIYFDPITGLPNQRRLREDLSWLLGQRQMERPGVALINICLDDFKKINQSFGSLAGDYLLGEISQRLYATFDGVSETEGEELDRAGKGLYRCNSAEFTLLLPAVMESGDIRAALQRVQEVLSTPFLVEEQEVKLTASIGMALAVDLNMSAEEVVSRAAEATHVANEAGGDCHRLFSDEIRLQSRRRLRLETDLRKSIENEQLELFYQPKLAADTQLLIGMEALLRWRHPQHGIQMPGKFIPVAEELNLMQAIGNWVIDEGCRQLSAWSERGMQNLKLALNVSQQQLRSKGIVQQLTTSLQRYGVSPQRLVLEITESLAMADSVNILEILEPIRELGVTLSIDDFGTGFSSLSHLSQLPIDELKIDRAFITAYDASIKNRLIVKTIVAMAHSMNLTVVAEGVETEEQVQALRAERCDVLQGFYFSKPLPAEEFFQYFDKWGSGTIQLDL